MHETHEEAGIGIIGGKQNVPVLLKKAQGAEEAEAFGQGLVGLGEAVKDDFIQTAVQRADGSVLLRRGVLDDLCHKRNTHTHMLGNTLKFRHQPS